MYGFNGDVFKIGMFCKVVFFYIIFNRFILGFMFFEIGGDSMGNWCISMYFEMMVIYFVLMVMRMVVVDSMFNV